MADQTQTGSLDQGATKDSSSSNEPDATVNSGDKTSGIAFYNHGTDNESSAEGNEGVNDVTNRTINEGSESGVNDKIADDENDIIHKTIRKEGSNKVDENKKGNETVSLGADETVGKGENTVGKGIRKTIYRGNDTKNNKRNDKKRNCGANDKENNETSDTSHAEKTIPGIDKTTHAGERHGNKTSNDETNLMTSKPADERNDKATQKGSNANDKGNNERNDTSHVETTKDGTGKITLEGVSDENKTDNDVTNVLIGKPANEEHDEASDNREGETNNEKDIVTNNIHADQTDANTKEKSYSPFEDDSLPNEEGNDSDTPVEKKITSIDRQETAKNETNDEIVPEGTVCNEDANVPQNAPMTCPNESPAAYVESHGKKKQKKKGFFAGVLSNLKSKIPSRKNEKHIPASQSKQPSVNNRWNDTKNIERNDEVTQKGNSKANDKETNETSDTSDSETNTGTDKKTHDGESQESKAGNDQTNVLIGKPVNEKHDEASYNRETNNDGNEITTDNVNPDQTDATVKERSQTFEDDSCSNETTDEKMNTGMDRHETANKETNGEIIPESIVYKKDANRQNEATMTCSNEMDNMLIHANKQLKKKHQELINQTLKDKKSNAKTLNETTALLKARDGELDGYRSVIQQNNADISQLTVQIQQLQEEKSDLILRLSKVASAKLTQNNPNIADLSDANRPTKLAEQFSELYDNEYTDAIEELKKQQGLEEQAAIESMLTLLQAANEECVELARKQEDGKTCLTTFSFKVDQYPILRERSVLTDSGDNECSTVKSTIDQETEEVRIEIQLPDEHRKSLSDIRRLCATKVEEDCSMSKIIASKIALQREITPESGPKTLAYITKCAKLCWYMIIKEPPVLVGFHAVVDGEPFNKDTYKSYTNAGELLDFVVWPPLYLHKDGPLLCKGVAQGK